MSTTPSSPPVLPDKPKRSKTLVWVIVAVVAIAAIIAAIFLIPALSNSNDSAEGESTTVRLGTTDAAQGHWPVLQEILAEEGIELEIVAFDTYDTPNPALADGEIDLNAFQHIDYLSNHNVATGDGLAVVGPTLLVPLPIYSAKYDDVASIPDGSRILVPEDATNQARALKVLEAAELIELDPSVITPTPADIVSGRIEVEPVEASLTAPSLQDPQVAAAVVNNTFAADTGILDQAIFSVSTDDANSWPYINIIAARAGEEDNEAYRKVWEAYHDPRVAEIVVEESGDTAVIVEETPQQVRDWLAEVEAQKEDAQ